MIPVSILRAVSWLAVPGRSSRLLMALLILRGGGLRAARKRSNSPSAKSRTGPRHRGLHAVDADGDAVAGGFLGY